MSDPAPVPHPSSRAWYGATIAEFLRTESDQVVGRLTRNSDVTVLPTQRDAWLAQIALRQGQLGGLAGSRFLEFSIPRMGRRVDTVLLIGPVIFVVEFKVGLSEFDRAALDQVWDYALDLKNFHEASHRAPIVPMLIATGAGASRSMELHADEDRVYRPLSVPPAHLRATVDLVLRVVKGETLDAQAWAQGPLPPDPHHYRSRLRPLCAALGRGHRPV
jgi:hypothetical protein